MINLKGERELGTQMKATGEVMAIGRTYEESLLKAIRSLEYGVHHLGLPNGESFDLIILKNVFHTKMMNDYFSSAKQLEEAQH